MSTRIKYFVYKNTVSKSYNVQTMTQDVKNFLSSQNIETMHVKVTDEQNQFAVLIGGAKNNIQQLETLGDVSICVASPQAQKKMILRLQKLNSFQIKLEQVCKDVQDEIAYARIVSSSETDVYFELVLEFDSQQEMEQCKQLSAIFCDDVDLQATWMTHVPSSVMVPLGQFVPDDQFFSYTMYKEQKEKQQEEAAPAPPVSIAPPQKPQEQEQVTKCITEMNGIATQIDQVLANIAALEAKERTKSLEISQLDTQRGSIQTQMQQLQEKQHAEEEAEKKQLVRQIRKKQIDKELKQLKKRAAELEKQIKAKKQK